MLDFLKEDIKRFKLDDSKAIYLIAIGISKMFPPPINAIIAIPFSLLLLAEFSHKLNAILGIGIAVICLGAAGKITHMDIFGLPANATLLIGLGIFSIGILYNLITKPFQFNKLYVGISVIVLLFGVGLKVTHLEFFGTSANTIILQGSLMVGISYFYRFLLKTNKNITDILKVLIVWSFVLGYCLTILHQGFGFELMQINSILLLIWPLMYFYQKYSAKKQKY